MASVLGGPLAAVYVINKNFQTLENRQRASASFHWGMAYLTLTLILMPLLPEDAPSALFPLMSAVVVHQVVTKYQLTRQDILQSDVYERHSNWHVVGMCFIAALVFVLVILLWLSLLTALGIVSKD